MRELDLDAVAAATFHEAMAEVTSIVTQAVVRAYDFSGMTRLVDVGGGYGALLAAVLAAYPKMRGVLYDREHAAEGARTRLARAGLLDRCEVLSGDFFHDVPEGDGYILKSVVHDWNDADAARILRNCRRRIRPGGRLLLVEQIAPARVSYTPADQRMAIRDLNMLVMLGGRERSLEEFRRLLGTAQFALGGWSSAALDYRVIEGLPN